jgi:aspartate kinase
MALVVHKYGGTSLATTARIRDVAARIGYEKRAGNDVVVVVSAMGDSTDRLASLANDICPKPDPRELDMLLTVGERISMSLVSMALNSSGLRSISLTGSQSGIITDGAHTHARILDVRGDRILEGIADGRIVIVAGFQGVSAAREVTTLGRGGSDLTAVALAARFAAVRCDIYTDVDGVYTADPGRVPTARRVAAIDHEAMIAYAELGAGVFHPRAARWAARERVPVVVRSSFIPGPGTVVGGPPEGTASEDEGHLAIGIGLIRQITVQEFAAPPARVSEALNEEAEDPLHLVVDGGRGSLAALDNAAARDTAGEARAAGIEPIGEWTGDLVSVVVRPERPVAAAIEGLVVNDWRVHPELLTGPCSVSLLVAPEQAEEAVLVLHRALIESPLVADPA